MATGRKGSLERVERSVASGQALSAALARETGISAAIQSLIACGESSGSLGRSLASSRSILDREKELRSRCMSAMSYPAVVGIAAIALAIGLMRGVMPQIAPLLKGLHADLPPLTSAVMAASDLIVARGWAAALAALAIGAAAWALYSRSLYAKRIAQRALQMAPLVGALVRSYHLSIFFSSFGSLVGAGMQTDQALSRSISGISWMPLQRSLAGKADRIGSGERASSICDASMPAYVEPLLAAGEMSGRLPQSLIRASELIDKDIDRSLKRLTALLEPAMMAGIGAMVGAIALSIMMPIYDISKTLQR